MVQNGYGETYYVTYVNGAVAGDTVIITINI